MDKFQEINKLQELYKKVAELNESLYGFRLFELAECLGNIGLQYTNYTELDISKELREVEVSLQFLQDKLEARTKEVYKEIKKEHHV
jgi:hypothetical protein